jgi:predicted XRE-type DNA-binding protein
MIGERFESVWDAIESTPAEAANMKARSELMIAIQVQIENWQLTQAESAKRLGITQPRLNDLLRGRVHNFSLDALMNLAVAADLTVEWRITPHAA